MKFLRIREVVERTGLSRSSIYQKIKDGLFPKQVKISANASAWLESEVDSWIKSALESRGEQ